MASYSDLRDKVVLITGSSSGIGSGVARAFAAQGSKVVITSRSVDKLEAEAAELRRLSNSPSDVVVIPGDVTDESFLETLIAQTISKFSKLDVLINNAGQASISSVLDSKYTSELSRILDSNLKSAMVLTHFAMKHLIALKGTVINMSSILGTRPVAVMSPYSASKGPRSTIHSSEWVT